MTYETFRNDFSIADKYRDDSANGLREALQADARFFSGQTGLGETLDRENAGFNRFVSSGVNSLFAPNSSEAESQSVRDILPSVDISDGQQSQFQSMDSDGDMTRLAKKEKAAYLENQQGGDNSGDYGRDSGGENPEQYAEGDMTRLFKKEKMAYLESQPSEFDDQ